MAVERQDWIDVAKGLGMGLVVLGHMSIPKGLEQFIYSFHVPLFFFVSGFLHRDNFSGQWCLRKLDALLLGYVLWGALEIATCSWAKGESASPLLHGYLLGNGAGVSWFLMCLLVVELLGGGIVRLLGARAGGLCEGAVLLAVAGAGVWVERSAVQSVLMSCSVLPALALWLAGHLFARGCFEELVSGLGRGVWGLVPLLVGVGAWLARIQRVDMGGGFCGNPCVFYATALILILAVLLGCRCWLSHNGVLRYIGTRSLLFMGWHIIVPPVLKCMLGLVGVDVDASAVVKAASRAFNIAVLLGLVAFCDRFVPVLAGRARVLSSRL